MESTNFLNVAWFFQKIYDLFTGNYALNFSSVGQAIAWFISFIRPFSIFISLLLLTGIIYSLIRTRAILNEALESAHGHGHDEHGHEGGGHGEHAEGGGHGEEHGGGHAEAGAHSTKGTTRWEKIEHHINSANSSDWRLAILECDIILDEMLTKMGYHGETLSDKLKGVERSDFLSIDQAWEAHRVRNAIAHEGSNFLITDREARRVVGLYEEVFKEFHYV